MDIHLSEEAARYIQSRLASTGCRSPSEFVERLLRVLQGAEPAARAEKDGWLHVQEISAARIWDNDADARYDAL